MAPTATPTSEPELDITITAYNVPERLWAGLRAVLQCYPADLGRWKNGRTVTLWLTKDFPDIPEADVRVWLRAQNIRHELKTTLTTNWEPRP